MAGVTFSTPVLTSASRFQLVVDFEANLLDPELEASLAIKGISLPGRWSVELAAGANEVDVTLTHNGAEASAFGARVAMSGELFWRSLNSNELLHETKWYRDEPAPAISPEGGACNCVSVVVKHSTLAAAKTRLGPVYDPGLRNPYRFVVLFNSSEPLLQNHSPEAEHLATYLSDLHLKQTPHDLRLFFPQTTKRSRDAELWVNAEIAGLLSAYFQGLLSAGFSEATRRSKRTRKSGAQPLPFSPVVEKDFDDSDDDTDAFLFSTKSPELNESNEASELSFREITITQTAFTTYHALLVYLHTGFVRFAPLRSACPPSSPASSNRRNDILAEALKDTPSLPLPVSPKSVFRLLDLLLLSDDDGKLASLCLRAISDSLTPAGAPLELFSDASICDEEIREVVLDYVVKNWDVVSETTSWKDKMEEIARDEVSGAAGVMVELMQAREVAWKKKLGGAQSA
ncbi:hypothetical protein JCM6882_005584 [Rhodosporidiobolus microsporus]